MAHTVIGTAGHIDHGKTQLVRALTGSASHLADTEIFHLLTMGVAPYAEPQHAERFRFNSFFVAFTTTLIQVMTSALAAFAFSRLRWRGRDAVFLLYLGTMMIPGLTLMIPNFQVMVWLGFLNTYHGLIIPASFTAFGTFLLRQFMLGIPTALDEAAHIDGASNWQIFVDVILPLARPGIIALAMITFLFQYQQFFWPLIMLNDQQFFPLPVGLLELDSTFGQQTELIMAAATITVAPLIVLFVVCQKFLVRGIQLGGVKG